MAKRQTFISRSRSLPPSEKAAFHQVVGAGRKKVTRPFLGLTDADEAAIVDRLERHLRQRLGKT